MWNLYLIILLLLYHSVHAPLPCYLYPKVFGGANHDTYFRSIDVNHAKDLIVAGGDTADGSIHKQSTGTIIPIIVAYSITTS